MLPQHVLDEFAHIPHDTTLEDDYFGVFNQILSRVCFAGGPFITHPFYFLPLVVHGTLETGPFQVVTYVVRVKNQPIFFLEIKNPCHLDTAYSRVHVDMQMRAKFCGLYNITPTSMLHGISAMGQKLAFYCFDKAMGHVTPDFIEPSYGDTGMIDTVPAERWDTDITTEEGYQRFMTVISDVKQMAADCYSNTNVSDYCVFTLYHF